MGFMVLGFMLVTLPFSAKAETLNRQLSVGMSGTDVSILQRFLAQDVHVYPQGLITGYFGFLTKSAVSNFQSNNGIANIGRVGPATLFAINSQMPGGITSTNGVASIITTNGMNISRNSAVLNWTTNDMAKGVVYYSTSPLSTYERQNSVDVSGFTAMTDSNFRNVQSVVLSNLQANTTYYYLIYTTNQAGNVSVTWPSTFQTTN